MGRVNELWQDEMERRYYEVAADHKLHPDDDCDQIMDLLCELFPQYRDEDDMPSSPVSITAQQTDGALKTMMSGFLSLRQKSGGQCDG